MSFRRRRLLQTSLAFTLAASHALGRLTNAQNAQGLTGPAYEVSKWSGPVSSLGLLDTTGKTWQPAKVASQWGVKVFPTTLMLDSKGRPQQRVKGEVDWTSPAAGKLIEGLLKP